MPLATLGVHDLRYRLAFEDDAHQELAAQGHGYLTSLTPVCVVLAILVAAELIARLARASEREAEIAPRLRLAGLVAAITLSLIGIYATQELLEGLLSAGHPSGLGGVFGDGGWWSLPIALVFGAIIALFLRGVAKAVALVGSLRDRTKSRPSVARCAPLSGEVFLARLSPLATAAPGRAPPEDAFIH